MLKITRVQGDTSITLRLEGKLLAAWTDELRLVCAQIPPNQIHLDLTHVNFADAAGIELIRQLLKQRATIKSCSGFIAELLRREENP